MAEERDVEGDSQALLERYESLRERALGAAPDGHRLGLAVLLGGGVVSWMAAWRERVPVRLAPQPPSAAPPPAQGRRSCGCWPQWPSPARRGRS